MDETSWEEQVDAEAESEKGEETCAPLAGELTVTPAIAGSAGRASSNGTKDSLERRRMTFL
jgi:hypothetical protein